MCVCVREREHVCTPVSTCEFIFWLYPMKRLRNNNQTDRNEHLIDHIVVSKHIWLLKESRASRLEIYKIIILDSDKAVKRLKSQLEEVPFCSCSILCLKKHANCSGLTLIKYVHGGAWVAKSCPTLVTLWTIALQTPLSMGFPKQEYWTGFPLPSPEDPPHSGIQIRSPALQTNCLLTETPGKPSCGWVDIKR